MLSGAQSLMVAHQFTIISWFGLCVLALVFYHLLSDGDFSFLLTLGSVVRMFAFFILLIKLYSEGPEGVSGKTLLLYLVAFVSRLSSILQFEGYLPYDSSGDWLYQLIEVTAMLFVCAAIYFFHTKADDRVKHQDSFFFGQYLPGNLSILALIIPCALLALIFKPNLNGHFFADYSWTVACYVETFALVPQVRAQ